jgi:hypothetical protein
VLLCAALLRGSPDDHALMRLLPDTNAPSSKRSIINAARRLVEDGHSHEVLTIILRSILDAAILAEAQRLRDSLPLSILSPLASTIMQNTRRLMTSRVFCMPLGISHFLI